MESHSSSDASIKVCIRVRPPDSYAQNPPESTLSVDGVTNNNSKYCLDVTTPTSLTLLSKPDPKAFTFDYVAGPSVSQEDIFSYIGRPIIDGCMDGYNGTVFAYGQTGSGKTFTMIGPCSEDSNEGAFTHEMRGVIPRSLEYLFSLINREKQKLGEMVQFLCKCCFIEIYNEQIYDLLDSAATTGLHLRENMKRGVYVDGITEQIINTAFEAYQVLNQGWLNRHVASTSMNRESSRSHAVFMLSVESKIQESFNGVIKIRSSVLNLVDLAGSERQRDTNTAGIRIKEAGSINKSLSVLGSVINSLVEMAAGKSRHVHYRDSKLTFLLRDSLGGNSKTNLIANVHPLSRCFGETFSTLQFARRAKLIKNKAKINEDTTGNVIQLQLEIKQLRETISELRGGAAGPVQGVPVQEPNMAAVVRLRVMAEADNMVLKDKVSKLQELSRKKDNSLKATKMILKLRDSHISNLEKQLKLEGNHGCSPDEFYASQINRLQDEIKQWKHLAENHPDLTKYAMENNSLRAEVARLKEAYRDGGLETELDSLRQYTLELERRSSAKEAPSSHEDSGGSQAIKELAEVKIKLSNSQEQCQRLQMEIDSVKKQFLVEREEMKTRVTSLESELCASNAAYSELEKKIGSLKIRHRIEMDSLSESHMKSVKSLTTPTSVIKRSCSTTSTPVQSLQHFNVGKEHLRQKLFFRPLSSSARMSEASNDLPSTEECGVIEVDTTGSRGEEEGEGRDPVDERTEATHSDEEVGVVTDPMWVELRSLQEDNTNLRRDLESKEYDFAQMKGRESYLVSQVESYENSIKHLREEVLAKENQLSDNQRLNQETVSRLNQEEQVLRVEVRDLKLCLQSADKELAEVKKDLKLNKEATQSKLNPLLEKIGSLEQEMALKTQLYEDALKDLHVVKEEAETLREEVKFKTFCIQDKENELGKLNKACTTMAAENNELKESLELEKEKASSIVDKLSNSSAVELAAVVEERDLLQRERNALQDKVSSYDSELAAVKSSLETLRSQDQKVILELKGNVNQLRGREAELTAQIESAEQEKSEQQLKLNQCLSDIDSLKLEITSLQDEKSKQYQANLKEIRGLELQQEINEVQIGEFSARLLEMDNRCKELEQELKAKDNGYSELQKELSNKNDKIQGLKNSVKKLSGSKLDTPTTVEWMEESVICRLEEEKATYSDMITDLHDLLGERDSEIDEYKDKVKRYTELESEYELYKTKNASQQYKMEADLEEYSCRVKEMEGKMEGLSKELQSLSTMLSVAEQERATASKLASELQLKYDTAQGDLSIVQDHLQRVRTQEEMLFKEKEDLRSQLEAAAEAKAKLVKENQEIVKENARLSGHRNIKQRIQFHAKLKIDYHKLLEDYRELQEKYQSQSDYVRKLGGQQQYDKTMPTTTAYSSCTDVLANTSKENRIPPD